MPLSDRTRQMLERYQDASRQVEAIHAAKSTEGSQAEFVKLSGQARELVSRCLLTGDSRLVVFLLEELELFLRGMGHREASACIGQSAAELAKYFHTHGTF